MGTILLIVSIIVQLSASLTAFLMIRRTAGVLSWLFLAAGLFLMTVRRGVSLFHLLISGDYAIDVPAEAVALVTSVLMLFGVLLISRVFDRFRSTGDILKKELEENEKNRIMLEDREREYRTLINNLPGFAYRCANDRNWTMHFISKGCSDITGYTSDEFMDGRKIVFNDLIDPEYRERVWGLWQRVLSKKGTFESEYPIVTRANTRRWVWERGCGVFSNHGELLCLEGFITDITERRKAEEDLQKVEKLASVGTLAGGIAHDFNNIMTGVYGNISMAIEHLPPDSRAAGYIRQAESSISRATRLTKQLLTFARGGEPVLEKITVQNLVEEVVRFDLSGSSVEPVFQWQEGLWKAEVDKSQLQQVFSNITINAAQAMPQGGRLFVGGTE